MIHLKDFFGSLQKNQVRYLLCGGVAVNLYGIPRMTADIDVLIDWEEKNVEAFEKSVAEHGYKKRLFFELKTLLLEEQRLKMFKEKNLIAYSYSSDLLRSLALDVLISAPVRFAEAWDRKEVKHLGDIPVYLLGVDDLIKLKEYADREQDRQDIINLKKFKK